MTTEHPFPDNDRRETPTPAAAAPEPGAPAAAGPPRKARQRSAYLFPSYGFSVALDIARRVEESGGGTLSEETLAVNLGLSKSSSGFRLRCLAARHFNLLAKQGATVTTTAIAKSILKPTGDDDALRGYRQSFLSIPLFCAVAERYQGQRLPDSQTLRNVLEREFLVEHNRVQQAERLLLESARDTYLLKQRGDGPFLDISGAAPGLMEQSKLPPPQDGADAYEFLPPPVMPGAIAALPAPNPEPPAQSNVITFSLDEIGQLSAEDFETVWRAIGILVRSRNSRRHADPEAPGGALDYL